MRSSRSAEFQKNFQKNCNIFDFCRLYIGRSISRKSAFLHVLSTLLHLRFSEAEFCAIIFVHGRHLPPVQSHCILNLTTSTLNSYKSAAAGGHPLPLCALSGYENKNIRAKAERQPLCGQVNLQKNKMIDLIIALRYNKAVKSGIENI